MPRERGGKEVSPDDWCCVVLLESSVTLVVELPNSAQPLHRGSTDTIETQICYLRLLEMAGNNVL